MRDDEPEFAETTLSEEHEEAVLEEGGDAAANTVADERGAGDAELRGGKARRQRLLRALEQPVERRRLRAAGRKLPRRHSFVQVVMDEHERGIDQRPEAEERPGQRKGIAVARAHERGAHRGLSLGEVVFERRGQVAAQLLLLLHPSGKVGDRDLHRRPSGHARVERHDEEGYDGEELPDARDDHGEVPHAEDAPVDRRDGRAMQCI
ncbi:MAG: hypothetical protein M3P06_05355 [Acidobacteriota bacterium]|nr:hypothetical protein [Acidobacteriota bacterium]